VSEENVEIVRALQPSGGVDLVALVEGAQSALPRVKASLFAADFESSFLAPDMQSETGHGLEGFVTGWRDWLIGWQRYEIWAEDFIDAGDAVVVFARVVATTRRDSIQMEHAPAAVWALCNGIVRRVDFYYDRTEALKAAGLVE
jgi:hypothetical protein